MDLIGLVLVIVLTVTPALRKSLTTARDSLVVIVLSWRVIGNLHYNFHT